MFGFPSDYQIAQVAHPEKRQLLLELKVHLDDLWNGLPNAYIGFCIMALSLIGLFNNAPYNIISIPFLVASIFLVKRWVIAQHLCAKKRKRLAELNDKHP